MEKIRFYTHCSLGNGTKHLKRNKILVPECGQLRLDEVRGMSNL